MGSSGQFNGSQLVERSVQRVSTQKICFAEHILICGFQGTPVILVTFNYRLGPLGFPQGQEGLNF
jgi:hypothetical protein